MEVVLWVRRLILALQVMHVEDRWIEYNTGIANGSYKKSLIRIPIYGNLYDFSGDVFAASKM